VRIGELARMVGVSTDTVRFYERSGWLPRPSRRENEYREYRESDADHLRLLTDLRRLDVPLEDAARIASWCHSGHCTNSASELPRLVAERRATLADRIARLQALDERLAALERHLRSPGRGLRVLTSGACCEAAEAVTGASDAICDCCVTSGRLGVARAEA
jgi:DNA-binding transcriptional MerR regulator